MKILMVVPAIGDVYGGPSKCVVEIAQALANLGIEVDLVTTNANGSEKLNVPLNTWISGSNYRVQYFSFWGLQDYKISISLTQWLFQNIKDYELVHTNAIFSFPVLPAYWACQKYNVPYLVTPHGMLEPWALSYKARKKQLYYSLLEKPALQQASAIQMLASTEAERVKPLNLKAPIVVIPNGIHHQDFETLPSPELFYKQFPETREKTLVLFLARIDPKKGLDLLAKAFTKVQAQFPNAHLVIAGPDNIGYLAKVKELFTEAGCLDMVTFTGMLTGSVKYAALNAASAFVAPSYSEGFSMSVLEAMASGLPCVITTGCNFPEAGTANAAYVVNIDAEEIADALIKCLKDPDQSKAIGDRARQLILKEYTWDQVASKLVQVYESILQKQPILI